MDAKYKDILKYYVLGYDFNKKQVYRANIFNNIYVYNSVVELIKKYLTDRDFEAFHKDLTNTVKYESNNFYDIYRLPPLARVSV